jgi:signal transduction histidine kinase
MALGLLVAVGAVIRLRVLERQEEQHRAATEEAEQQMRRLSHQLVATQEEERRSLSRELHDHVGQMLTALRMELGRIERLGGPTDLRLAEVVAESRTLVDTIVATVRDLSLGLRPSMLDDLGLQAAVEWHVRDFTRRCGLRVDLTIEGDLEHLPDHHRTCIYRVVQEALTNCARHSGAANVEVNISGASDGLKVAIIDDGVGFDAQNRSRGLGLRGLVERVRELHGSMSIRSQPGVGTAVRAVLPQAAAPSEETIAHPAR